MSTKPKPLPIADRLRRKLFYCPDSGLFTWRQSGKRAGSVNAEGYRIIRLEGESYFASRLAIVYERGDASLSADLRVDHINRQRDDNRFENLRVVTPWENCFNTQHARSAAGVRGVHFCKKKNRFCAVFYYANKRVWRRYFREIDDAVRARVEVVRVYHGNLSAA